MEWNLISGTCGFGLNKAAYATTTNLHEDHSRCAAEAGVSWPLPEGLTDEGLEALLSPARGCPSNRPQLDWGAVHTQLSRKGMTLERACHTYRQAHPDGYNYGHFCALYDEWSGRHN